MDQSSARLSIRVDLANGRFGPGKARLLDAIAETGSISAAARRIGMSYARAWHLTEDMNTCFREPLVATQAGGSRGGGAELTAAGREVLRIYAEITERAERAAARDLAALAGISRAANSTPGGSGPRRGSGRTAR